MPRPFAKKKTFIDHASDFAESALESLESAFDQAREAAGPAIADARERAVPLLQDARDRAVPLLHDARETAAEKAATGAAAAKAAAVAGAAAAAQQAAQGRELAAAKLAEVKGEPEPKGGKLKKLFFFGALAAIGGLLFRKLRNSTAEEDNWQSSYVPPPPAPAPSPADGLADPLNDPLPGQAATDDPGGAGPDEALSDAVDTPHEPTTPDEPAEVVEIDGETSKK
jgi:hypothetical protein